MNNEQKTLTSARISHTPLVPLYPTPDAEGLAKTKDFYLNRLGKPLTDEEAYEALGSVMRFLYLINLPPAAPLPEEASPEVDAPAAPAPAARASSRRPPTRRRSTRRP